MSSAPRPLSEPVLILQGGGLVLLALGIVPVLWLGHPAASFARDSDIGVTRGRVAAIQARRPDRSGSLCRLDVSYSVHGDHYELTDLRDRLQRARSTLCREGRRVTVYYLRSRPGVGSMDRERFGNWPFLAAALALLPIGAGLLYSAERLVHGPRPPHNPPL